MSRIQISFTILFVSILMACGQKKSADLILTNGHIYLANESFDTASTIIVKDGKILAIGNDSLLNEYQSKETVNLNGAYVYPGFNDAHCHFSGYAMDKYKLALFGTGSWNEVLARIVDYNKTNKRVWIEGRGWDQNDWKIKEFPTKKDLDSLFPNTPIYLVRIDGHAALCNQKALDIAAISINSTVEGGEFLKQDGELTGILIDKAMDLVKSKIPLRTEDEIIDDLIQAQHDCFALGLTSVTDCGVTKSVYQTIEKAYQKKALHIRNSIMLASDQETKNAYIGQTIPSTPYLHVIGFKLYADGALGSRGASLINDYHDRHGHRGLDLLNRDSLQAWANDIIKTDYQLCTHAIGDQANRTVLQVYANVLKSKNDRRWRIEHAQVVAPSDRHFFGEYSIIPSVQPTHATSDMYWAEQRLGSSRIESAYAYQSLLQQNNYIPLGTDFPVEEINPLATFCAAVFRQNKNQWPEEGFQKKEALTRREALLGMTLWAAKAAREEHYKGSLEKGKVADMVIMNCNLMTANLPEIYDAPIGATYVNGKVVYTAENKNDRTNAGRK
jgi:predicted amidohydrolase YtcJ